MVKGTNRTHLRSGPVCGMQMMMKDSKAHGSMKLQGSMTVITVCMATNDSDAAFGGLVSTT